MRKKTAKISNCDIVLSKQTQELRRLNYGKIGNTTEHFRITFLETKINKNAANGLT